MSEMYINKKKLSKMILKKNEQCNEMLEKDLRYIKKIYVLNFVDLL